jgi:hypothetical protein
MKMITALLGLILSVVGHAQDNPRVELNAEEISVGAASAVVVRTNKSPDTVELTFRVPMANSVCERYETRYVVRASGAYCGYDYFQRRVRMGQQCVRRNPQNNQCLRWADTYRIERVQTPRICPVPETYCAQYGTRTTYENESMKLKFKNLPALGDSESETFSIAATQRRYDSGSVNFEVTPMETLREYQIKRKKILFFKTKTYVVEEK